MPRRQTQRERGAALLMAMLTVTLVATFAATALWQQWRAVEVEAAERSRAQSAWILVGALDWARLILRLDALDPRTKDFDHLAEPWAIPLQETRLSTFLAADKGVFTGSTDDLPEVFLSGRIVDLQSRLNAYNLVTENAQPVQATQNAFARLFNLLNLPPSELQLLVDGMRLARTASTQTDADVPLLPRRFDQLNWLGLSPATLQALAPHVTVIDAVTTINLNTASAEVIAAAADADLAGAQGLVTSRAGQHLRSTAEASKLMGQEIAADLIKNFGVSTVYFEVHGRLRLEDSIVNERSLVKRQGSTVTVEWRERTAGELLQ